MRFVKLAVLVSTKKSNFSAIKKSKSSLTKSMNGNISLTSNTMLLQELNVKIKPIIFLDCFSLDKQSIIFFRENN